MPRSRANTTITLTLEEIGTQHGRGLLPSHLALPTLLSPSEQRANVSKS
jgi:hypothetical protein